MSSYSSTRPIVTWKFGSRKTILPSHSETLWAHGKSVGGVFGWVLGPQELCLSPPGWRALPSSAGQPFLQKGWRFVGLGRLSPTRPASFPALNDALTEKDFTVFTKRLFFQGDVLGRHLSLTISVCGCTCHQAVRSSLLSQAITTD